MMPRHFAEMTLEELKQNTADSSLTQMGLKEVEKIYQDIIKKKEEGLNLCQITS